MCKRSRLGLLQERGDDMNANQPICKTCGVLWVDHMGIEGTCAENAQLRKERDEARREICELSSRDSGELDLYASNKEAKRRDWDCFEEK